MDDRAPLETRDTVQKSRRFLLPATLLIIFLIVAAAGTYAWYFVYNPCEVEAVKEASAFLVTQLNTYDRVFQVAVTASRTSPDHPVNTLKQIFMDTQEMIVPACMQISKQNWKRSISARRFACHN